MTKFITEDGLKKIREELEKRKNEIRQSIAASIKEAKEQGDLSENAEYSEAKSQQSENEREQQGSICGDVFYRDFLPWLVSRKQDSRS